MFFISVLLKLSVDLRPQEKEILKGVHGLKFFYLVKDEKPFFKRCYANDKDVIVCCTKF